MPHEDAWLFDYYPEGACMVLWFITAHARRLRLTYPFAPAFHVEGVESLPAKERERFERFVRTARGLEWIGPVSRLDFWTNEPRCVLEIRLTDLHLYKQSVQGLADAFPALTYYDCDIPPEILFGYDTGLFATARCRIDHDEGQLHSFALNDDPQATDYEIPPMRYAELSATGNFSPPCPRLHSLTYKENGRSFTWDSGPPDEILRSFQACLVEHDPDIIWTTGGDSLLLPALFTLAQRFKIPLGLDREPAITRQLDYQGRSFMSYGRVLYHAPDYPLFGRWHIDRNNSFWVGAGDLHGLVEVARMAKIPVQRIARRSIGTGISSIQLDWAHRQGYLIPWKKSQTEAWKSVWKLLQADRGGLVFQPLTGVYEDVWELDFVSMFPSIMVRENVSPETVNCACCAPSADVPVLDYTICKRRRGLTAATLEAVIAKRAVYKARRKEAEARGDVDAYRLHDERQDSLKWLLVCCFGYLGYRNARFGRIEAHESICAFSREKLLRSKSICEDRGFRVLHAIVDSFWIQKDGATRESIDALVEEINAATNLTIAVEGHYGWLAFLPSRPNPDIPVPNRYFGAFGNGKLKFRGIELRRSDQPLVVKALQRTLLDMLAGARDLSACQAMREALLETVREAERAVRNFEIPVGELLLRRKTSKDSEAYRNNSMTAIAARQAVRSGVQLHAGEGVEFLVVNPKDVHPDSRIRILANLRAEDTYDPEFYADLLRRGAATLLEPLLGEPLSEMLGDGPARRARAALNIEQPQFL